MGCFNQLHQVQTGGDLENTHLLDEDVTPVARREMSERMAEEEKGRDKVGREEEEQEVEEKEDGNMVGEEKREETRDEWIRSSALQKIFN